MKLEGLNAIVLDCETLHSADACLICQMGQRDRHGLLDDHVYTPIGWNRKAELGLSIGCWYSYADGRYHWVDTPTLEATMQHWVDTHPLIVTYNGLEFDGPLLRAVLRGLTASVSPEDIRRELLCDAFADLMTHGYDILQAIWASVSKEERFTRGLCSLDAVSQANGFGSKSMTGALAPQLWREGHVAEVLAYCSFDVEITRRLFEKICTNEGRLLLGDGQEVEVTPPELLGLR